MPKSHKEDAVSFLKMIVAKNIREAYAKYVAPDFKHHNAWFPGTAEALMEGMIVAHKENPDTSIDIKHVIQDNDIVAVHSHVRHRPGDIGAAVVHIFRFKDSKIVEMWDVGMEIPKDSPNQFGMF